MFRQGPDFHFEITRVMCLGTARSATVVFDFINMLLLGVKYPASIRLKSILDRYRPNKIPVWSIMVEYAICSWV